MLVAGGTSSLGFASQSKPGWPSTAFNNARNCGSCVLYKALRLSREDVEGGLNLQAASSSLAILLVPRWCCLKVPSSGLPLRSMSSGCAKTRLPSLQQHTAEADKPSVLPMLDAYARQPRIPSCKFGAQEYTCKPGTAVFWMVKQQEMCHRCQTGTKILLAPPAADAVYGLLCIL